LAWLTEWLATDEGEAYSRSECTLDTNVRPDGRFRIEDVPAGKYRLRAEVREPGDDIPGTYGPELASIDTEIIIPEVPGGRSDVLLDVGTIELKRFKPRFRLIDDDDDEGLKFSSTSSTAGSAGDCRIRSLVLGTRFNASRRRFATYRL
jgi:hypothetical protein